MVPYSVFCYQQTLKQLDAWSENTFCVSRDKNIQTYKANKSQLPPILLPDKDNNYHGAR